MSQEIRLEIIKTLQLIPNLSISALSEIIQESYEKVYSEISALKETNIVLQEDNRFFLQPIFYESTEILDELMTFVGEHVTYFSDKPLTFLSNLMTEYIHWYICLAELEEENKTI